MLVIGSGRALQKARDVPKLSPDFGDHFQRRFADAAHGHCREPVGQHGPQQQPSELQRLENVDILEAHRGHERAEKRQRHQSGRADGGAFADSSCCVA